jgi:hypothetical protein
MIDLERQKTIEELGRRDRRVRYLGDLEITTKGIAVPHGLRAVPTWVQCIPYKYRGAVVTSWWYYQKPDSTYIYLQAPQNGRFLVTVGG